MVLAPVPLPDSHYKSLPMPGPIIIPMPAPEPKFLDNEYVKGASGAAVGWAVKNFCDWIWGFIKGLFKRKTE